MSKELSDLVNYVKSVHFKGLDQEVASLPFWEMSSFAEKKAHSLSLDLDEAHLFVQRNTRQLARTYPAGSRINSSNYNPQVHNNSPTATTKKKHKRERETQNHYGKRDQRCRNMQVTCHC
jgi:hypothetical protein